MQKTNKKLQMRKKGSKTPVTHIPREEDNLNQEENKENLLDKTTTKEEKALHKINTQELIKHGLILKNRI
jgi:hypothetical protein